MKKAVILLLTLAIVLTACKTSSEVKGRKIVLPPEPEITGGAIVETQAQETGQTAKEVLEQIREENKTVGPAASGTFYPPVQITGTGKDALKEKTRALMRQSPFNPEVDAYTHFGPKYVSESGEPVNLPEGYGEGCEHCD